MPTYEYVCRACGHLFEIVQSMRDDALTECPECGGELRKVFAPPAISFKGSGFYANDQRKKATTAGGDTSDKGEKKADAGSTSGSDSDAGGSSGSSDTKKDSKSDASPKKEPSSSSGSSSGSSPGSSSKEGSDP